MRSPRPAAKILYSKRGEDVVKDFGYRDVPAQARYCTTETKNSRGRYPPKGRPTKQCVDGCSVSSNHVTVRCEMSHADGRMGDPSFCVPSNQCSSGTCSGFGWEILFMPTVVVSPKRCTHVSYE